MNLDQVVQSIRKACDGVGTDDKMLSQAIACVSVQDVYALNNHFKASYGKELVDYLESEVSGDFGTLVVGSVTPEPFLAAKHLRAAMKGLGTDEKLLIETLVGRNNYEIQAIKHAYLTLYKKNLEEAIAGELSGDLKRFFLSLLQGARDEQGLYVNLPADVEALYRAGEGKLGTDEMEFVRILNTRNEAHLAQVFTAYTQRYGAAMEKVIKKEFSGNMEDALLATVQFVNNRGLYFAQLLESAMKGLGTDEGKLTRLVLRIRGTPLLQWTKDAYMHTFGKTLEHRVKGETSGNYRSLLLALLSQQPLLIRPY